MIRAARDNLSRLWNKLSVAEEKPLSVAILAAGAIIAGLEYVDYKRVERVKMSYQHVQEWEERGYKDAFDEVSSIIRNRKATALSTVPSSVLEDMEREDQDLMELNVTMNHLASDDGPRTELGQLIYFFDKLSVCVDQELCDEGLLAEFFRDNLIRFDVYTKAFVATERDEIEGYAELTERYVARLKSPPVWSIWDYWPL